MKKKLIVRQEDISDCGACSLLSIIRYYGGNASLENIRMFSLTNHTGVNALNLINCAKKYGFDAKGLRVDNFDNIKFPFIAHVNINKSLSHFIVVYDELSTCFDVMDPAYGHKKIDKEEFFDMFSGNIILLYPKILVNDIVDKKVLFKNIINIYKNKKSYLILILFMMLLALGSSLIFDLYINISLALGGGISLLILFIILLLFRESITYLVSIKKSNLVKLCSNELLQNFFFHIFKLPLKYIHLKDPGEIVKRTNELESISEFYIDFILNIITNLLIILPIFYLLIRLNFLSFVLTLICSIIYILYVIYSNRNVKELIDQNILSSTNYTMVVNSYISKLNSIKHIGNSNYFFSNIDSMRDEYFKDDLKFKKFIFRNISLKNIITSSFQLLNISIILIEYYKSIINIESVIAISTLFISILNSINSITESIPTFLYYKKIINKINDFYNLGEDDDKDNKVVGGDIYCRGLSFSYNGIDKVLKNTSFKINRGEKIFVRGISGAGKSTLCKILNKDLVDYQGTIKLGNMDLSQLTTKDTSIKIGYCSQNESLFMGTIKENIILGRDVSAERFNDIVRICNLEQIIKNKPFAFDTYLYGNGDELSGGEKNLILLARTLIIHKQIYILDEVLANVNEETEIKVIKNILNYFKSSTIIYVSHRNKSSYFDWTLNV